MDNTKTGNFIKELRIEKGLKQKDLADQLFVSVAAVSKWENGKGFPDISILSDLCKILDVTIEEIIEGEKNTMENNTGTVAEKLVEIASVKERSHLRKIRSLYALLASIILLSIATFTIFSMQNKETYVEYQTDSYVNGNMYIVNNGDFPTLCYHGKQFEDIEEFYVEVEKDEYMFIAIRSNTWNECFGSSENKQYVFETFNERPDSNSSERTPRNLFEPEHFKGVYLFPGSIYDFITKNPNLRTSTKTIVQYLMKYSTYIPYEKETTEKDA